MNAMTRSPMRSSLAGACSRERTAADIERQRRELFFDRANPILNIPLNDSRLTAQDRQLLKAIGIRVFGGDQQ